MHTHSQSRSVGRRALMRRHDLGLGVCVCVCVCVCVFVCVCLCLYVLFCYTNNLPKLWVYFKDFLQIVLQGCKLSVKPFVFPLSNVCCVLLNCESIRAVSEQTLPNEAAGT